MSPVERLQAAIDKLDAERNASSPGAWLAWREGAPGRQRFGVECGEEAADVVFRVVRRGDVELIETLHRTIGAQLVILRAEHERTSIPFAGMLATPDEALVALADAILGES